MALRTHIQTLAHTILLLLALCSHGDRAKAGTLRSVPALSVYTLRIAADTIKGPDDLARDTTTYHPALETDSTKAPKATPRPAPTAIDSLRTPADTAALRAAIDSAALKTDFKVTGPKKKFVPNPKKALWLALVLPGAGQIYNRKYWKLPIIYGGFVGCAYALRWNNMMYKDYSQAYMDLMDNDPNTQSYNKFLYLGNQIDNSNKEYYQKLFKNRKDRYRKWRDMSVFAMVGVYLISVVDAYVDASLSEFDISRDLSMKVSPAVIKERSEWTSYNPLNSSAVGLQCSLTF